MTATAGAVGTSPAVVLGNAYLTVENAAITVATGPTTLDVERLPFDRRVRLTGQIAAGAVPEAIHLGIDDPRTTPRGYWRAC